MKPYPKYKDSGIEWIGEIPSHWDVKPLKYMVAINKDALPETVSLAEEIHYIDIGGVDSLGNVAPPESMLFKDAPSRARRVVRQGDTIVSTVRTYLKAIAYIGDSDPHLIASTGFAVLSPDENTCGTYLYYLMTSQPVVDTICAWSTGVSYPAIAPSQLASLSLWIGDIDEQQSIATYLDRKTKQIDGLIEKKQNQIDLLREQRTAVINEAVTKGLNPKAKMKDSGIEWIGEIPEHWDVKQLRYLLSFVSGGTPPTENDEYWNGDLPWVSPKDMKVAVIKDTEDHVTQKAVQDNRTAIMAKGSALMVVRSGILQHTIPVAIAGREVAINQDIKGIVPKNNVFSSLFFVMVVKGRQNYLLEAWRKQGATVESLETDFIRNTAFPLPPLPEQQAITSFLDHRTSEFDTMIAKEERLIELLQEYRTSLISEVVTGKVDVRMKIEG